MRIISTQLPPEVIPGADHITQGRPAVVMAFDTLVDEKRVVVGVVAGVMNGPQPADLVLSPVGQWVLDRCLRHHHLNYPQGVVVVAGVAQIPGAKERLRQILAKAPDQALVLLVSPNDEVCAAVLHRLNIQRQPPNLQPH